MLGLTDITSSLNGYVYAVNHPAIYTDDDGGIVVAFIAAAVVGYGIYQGLEAVAHKTDEWGKSYGNLLDAASNPNLRPGEYEQAERKFIQKTGEMQKQVVKTVLTTPATSLTGPATLATTWKGLGFDIATDQIRNYLYDRLLGIDPKPNRQEGTLQSSRTTSTNTSSVSYWFAWGSSGGGSWGGPPSQGK